jgi:hypothetical protein
MPKSTKSDEWSATQITGEYFEKRILNNNKEIRTDCLRSLKNIYLINKLGEELSYFRHPP